MRNRTIRVILARGAYAPFMALIVAVFTSSIANAAVLNHGSLMGDTVAYLDVTETSVDPLPLFGAPITIGDTLAFFEPSSPNPSLGFSAQASGGSADITDGFLNLTVMAKPSNGIHSISFSESGDYTMSALGGSLARVSARLNVFELRITEVDNAPITPIVLSDLQTAVLNVPGDPISGQWSLASSFNLDQALNDAGQAYTLGATKLRVKIDNTLTALSQPGSLAGIFKKSFDIDLDTVVPEPTSLALAAFGMFGALARRRAR